LGTRYADSEATTGATAAVVDTGVDAAVDAVSVAVDALAALEESVVVTFCALASTVVAAVLLPLDADFSALLDALLGIIFCPLDPFGDPFGDEVLLDFPLFSGDEVAFPWIDLAALEGTDMECDS
jgi:hypothetical protein